MKFENASTVMIYCGIFLLFMSFLMTQCTKEQNDQRYMKMMEICIKQNYDWNTNGSCTKKEIK